jgi:hypothetical protein
VCGLKDFYYGPWASPVLAPCGSGEGMQRLSSGDGI